MQTSAWLERASAIHTNSAGEISETGAAQSEVTARDVEPLALAEPIVKCFARALTVPNCVGLSITDHLGKGRKSLRCRLLVSRVDGTGHFSIVGGRMNLS